MKEGADGRDKPGHGESAAFTVSGLFVVRNSDTTTAEPAGNDPDTNPIGLRYQRRLVSAAASRLIRKTYDQASPEIFPSFQGNT